ncbi:glycosyltransferase [Terrisporobacter sp.]
MSKISIIVPVYNTDKVFLKKCIQSLINQTEDDIEIIIINDGSNNDTSDYCNEYSKIDKRIKVIHQENQGVSVARNTGIDNATSKWITFVDPDDWVELDMCERLIENLEGNEDILIFTYTEVFKNKEIPKYWGNEKIYNLSLKEHELLQLGILDYNGEFLNLYFGAVWCNLYNREFINKYNIRFVEGLAKAQDTVFNLYALEYAKNIKYYNKSLYYYRHNENSVCYKYNKKIDNTLIFLLHEIKKFLIHTNKYDDSRFRQSYLLKSYVSFMETLKLNYFHSSNKKSYKENKNSFIELTNSYPYKEELYVTNFSTLSYKKKIIIYLIEKKQYLLLKILCTSKYSFEQKINKSY